MKHLARMYFAGMATVAFTTLAVGVAPASAADPIAIGWVGPLSPPGNYSGGQEMQWAVQLEVDQINKAGGVLGRPLKLIPGALGIDPRPIPCADGDDALGVVDEKQPCLSAGFDDRLVAVPDEAAQFVASEIIPDVLHRVQFR